MLLERGGYRERARLGGGKRNTRDWGGDSGRLG